MRGGDYMPIHMRVIGYSPWITQFSDYPIITAQITKDICQKT